MTDQEADPSAVATAVERLLAALPEDRTNNIDGRLRSRLEGYVTGLRQGIAGTSSLSDYSEGSPS